MVFDDVVKQIPTLRSKSETEEALNKYSDWFYPFSFINGASTVFTNDQVFRIHQSRARLIFPHLEDIFNGKWDSVSCCDIACNQGWFATQVALRGAKKVIGIDARYDHIKKAELIKDLSGISNLSFNQDD
jgi:2-polyprenyl-3-methyl-5-hydroxy-6-metoxy-1,4-benzoquinol methylase